MQVSDENNRAIGGMRGVMFCSMSFMALFFWFIAFNIVVRWGGRMRDSTKERLAPADVLFCPG